LSLTLICYCHLVGMAKIVRGSTLYDHETPLLDDLADLLYIKYGIAFVYCYKNNPCCLLATCISLCCVQVLLVMQFLAWQVGRACDASVLL